MSRAPVQQRLAARAGSLAVVGVRAWLLGSGVLFLAVLGVEISGGAIPVTPAAALLIVLLTLRRRSADAAIVALTLAPLLFAVAYLGLHHRVHAPSVVNALPDYLNPPIRGAWRPGWPFWRAMGIWGSPLLAGPPLALALSRRTVLRAAAWTAVTLAVLLTFPALVRAARHPSTLRASGAITRLREVGELPPLRDELARSSAPPGDTLALLHDIDGVRMGRRCLRDGQGGWTCHLTLDDDTRPWNWLHHPSGAFPPPALDEVVHVRRSRDGLLLVFESGGVLRGGAKTRVPPAGLTYRDLAEVLSPSPWALGAAALGVALAARQLARRRGLEARRAAILSGREGTLRADGWIDFADGSAAERVETPLPPGPVVAIAVAARGAVYRSRAVLELVAGERASLVDQLDAELAERDATAALAAVVASAPLAAAAWCGLVF